MNELLVVNIGKTRYADAWELQKTIFSARLEKRIGDVLLLTEHNHVFTLGKASNDNHILAKEDELSKKGIDVFWIDRGGDVTYHGPGQIVGYLIIDLKQHFTDIHRYLRFIEEAIIKTLSEFGIQSGREPEYTGVWVRNEKIAAIGVKVSKWITMHGFALNVNNDLSFYDRIIPCGIFHKGVTRLHDILQKEISFDVVHQHLIYHLSQLFQWDVKQISLEELTVLLHQPEAIIEEK